MAIVGSGVSGLAACWALNEYSSHEVHLFEAEGRLGGHTNTVPFESPSREVVQVDSGFIVLNPVTYPNFLAFLKHQRIPLLETEMSFSISRDQGRFEWAGINLATVFAQIENLWNVEMWRTLFDIVRFNAYATDILKGGNVSEESIGAYLSRNGYSQAFQKNYLLPMTAAVWSTPPDKCALDFPAVTLVQFLWNHFLLQVSDRPNWLTIRNGSQQYIETIMAKISPERVHLASPVKQVKQQSGKVKISVQGREHEFDHVIIATHADTALEILGANASDMERRILQNFECTSNQVILHSDKTFMPQRRKAWASWNYLAESRTDQDMQVSLTYYMNKLQHLPENQLGPVLVTMNPLHTVNSDTIQGRWQYSHPRYTIEAIKAQADLHKIQNKRGISFAGAWQGYGFHEVWFELRLIILAYIVLGRIFVGIESRFRSGSIGSSLRSHQCRFCTR